MHMVSLLLCTCTISYITTLLSNKGALSLCS